MRPIEIIRFVAKEFNLNQNAIIQPGRTKRVALARQLCAYLIKKRFDWSLNEIASFLGGRDHSTILYSINKIERLLKSGNDGYHAYHAKRILDRFQKGVEKNG